MQVYKMIDDSIYKDRLLGYLFYYERSNLFFAELLSDIDEWTAPFMFTGFVRRGCYSIDSFWAGKFVAQRIIPPDRQNLGMILKENGLKEYDEFKLLKLSEGRCSQDEIHLEKADFDDIVPEIKKRFEHKVLDCIPGDDGHVIVFFKDGSVAEIDVKSMVSGEHLFDNVLRDKGLFENVKAAPGGNGIEWGHDRNIPAEKMYGFGKKCSIKYNDMLNFVNLRLVDTAAVCEMLDCTRQYVNQLVSSGKLIPVRGVSNNNLFLKSDIEREESI